jgi:CHAT domain/SIR2-like domain
LQRRDAYLEIGLRYREGATFDVTIDYDDPADSGDRRAFGDEPIRIDPDVLELLVADEPQYGRSLTDMVLGQDKIGRFYEHARTSQETRELPLHLRLFIDPSAPPRYHHLRWESLRDGRASEPLAIRHDVFLSRFLSAQDWRPIAPPPKHDLRGLVVVANPSNVASFRRGLGPERLAKVDVRGELDRARQALDGMRSVVLGDEEPATLNAIAEAVERGMDVLYLVCHGTMGPNGSVLYLQRPDGTADPVDGDEFARLVARLAHRPTLAVLCACASAGSGDGNGDGTRDGGALSDLGPSLAEAGVAAVVAMQGNISMTTAAEFLPRFFRELASDGVVDRAMAHARAAVKDRPDWWVPVLFSRLKRGRTYYLPEFGAETDQRWRTLTQRIRDQQCTPVLGPGLADDILAPRAEIARSYADLWQMPIPDDRRGDLTTVAQYLRIRVAALQPADELASYLLRAFRDRYRGQIPDEQLAAATPEELVRSIGEWRRARDDDDPFEVVASLDLPIYVTTSWTTLLEDALTAAGREPLVRRFDWFLEREEAEVEDVGEPTVERPLVYHLFGTLDEPDSLVLSEDDYFNWLAAWIRRRKAILPGTVGKALTRRSLLFLGYRLDDWDFRILFHGIKNFGGSGQLRKRPHVGVQLNPHTSMIEPESAQEYLESYFGEDKVNIYWGDPRAFLDKLRQKMAEDDHAAAR